ncbi:ABC transporter substrate-binding protein [Actinocorallia sp. API 0066]|uniref:ABC transporter substrate-binding protein n=1 Tax=Actinocorallia sp. API 0066 TaxID=2896846 RepID=UPI001E620B67|nr:ABC transporter substrate-binding protein [Actinocorallia sp. API 0066]MCD0449170.1 ABC transporter substrate-binding protein [Actinocorallia sp. API 0066]
MTGRRPLSLLLAVACAALVTACGGTSADDTSPTAAATPGFPVTVENCGVTTTYERPPSRAVSMNQHATEALLALGLEKSMVGTAYLDDEVLPEYKAAYDGIKVIAEEYPSYETLLTSEPDFVYGGWSSAFDEKEGRSRDRLTKAGINTHVNIEECPEGRVTLATMDEEITTLAKIFGVPDRAKALIGKLHEPLDAVTAKLKDLDPLKVFVYDSGDKTAFTAGGAGIGTELIKLAGGVNLFADVDKAWADVSFEQVADRAPEVIVIYDYGSQSAADKKKFLLSNPALKDVPAIKNERFAVLPLSSTVTGVRVPAAVQSLAEQIHPDLFK